MSWWYCSLYKILNPYVRTLLLGGRLCFTSINKLCIPNHILFIMRGLFLIISQYVLVCHTLDGYCITFFLNLLSCFTGESWSTFYNHFFVIYLVFVFLVLIMSLNHWRHFIRRLLWLKGVSVFMVSYWSYSPWNISTTIGLVLPLNQRKGGSLRTQRQ